MRNILIITGLFALSLATACSRHTEAGTESSVEKEAQPCLTPVEIVLIPDQTGSMKDSGTRPVTVDDLEPVFDPIVECGGSIALLFVRNRPDQAVDKFRIEQPVPLPEPPVQNEGEENYEFSDRQADYDAQLADRRRAIADRKVLARSEFDAFKQRMKPLLDRPPASSTDLNSVLNISDVCLAQDDGWSTVPSKFLLLVSDGRDTNRRPRYRVQSGAKLFWVNGRSDPKTLAGVESARFVDLDSAVRAVINTLQKGGKTNAGPR
ncbi:MAG: hypothetical protein IPL32_03890 [Chloracidobacterium sp.]|nr:hypothetical protein [Chloracidobacterium sp.]